MILKSYNIVRPAMLPFRRLSHSRYLLAKWSNRLYTSVNSPCQPRQICSSGHQRRIKW